MTTPRKWFRVHPKLAASMTARFRRNGPYPLQPKTDILTLLGVHLLAGNQPLSGCLFTSDGIPEVEFRFRQADLLGAIGYERALGGPDAGTYRSSARRLARESLRRLTAMDWEFELKTWRSGWLTRAQFEGPPLTWSERTLVLRCYPAPKSRYFILFPAELLNLRESLSETAVRLLPWLYYRHRGNKQKGVLRHIWHVELPASLLVELGLVDPRRPGEGTKRVERALEQLARLGFIELLAEPDRRVRLLQRYFHSREES